MSFSEKKKRAEEQKSSQVRLAARAREIYQQVWNGEKDFDEFVNIAGDLAKKLSHAQVWLLAKQVLCKARRQCLVEVLICSLRYKLGYYKTPHDNINIKKRQGTIYKNPFFFTQGKTPKRKGE